LPYAYGLILRTAHHEHLEFSQPHVKKPAPYNTDNRTHRRSSDAQKRKLPVHVSQPRPSKSPSRWSCRCIPFKRSTRRQGRELACKTVKKLSVSQAPFPLRQTAAPSTTAVPPAVILSVKVERGSIHVFSVEFPLHVCTPSCGDDSTVLIRRFRRCV